MNIQLNRRVLFLLIGVFLVLHLTACANKSSKAKEPILAKKNNSFKNCTMPTQKTYKQTHKNNNETNNSDVLKPTEVNSKGNSSANILNKGLSTQQGKWIYYSNGVEGGKLYKMCIDNVKKDKLNDEMCSNINVVGDWVYYLNWSDLSNNIYKIRTNGTQKTKLNNDASLFLNVVDDWAYYLVKPTDNLISEDYALYKIRTDGTQKTKLIDANCNDINVVGNWIYYVDRTRKNKSASGMYKIKIDGTEKTSLGINNCTLINVIDDWIYYLSWGSNNTNENALNSSSENAGIYKIKTDGTEKVKISNVLSEVINIDGDWIYYANKKDTNKLYKVKTDGTGEIRLTKDGTKYINIVGEWVYYLNSCTGKLCRIRTNGTNLQLVD